MNTANWVAQKSAPKTLEEVKSFLLEIRNLDEKLISEELKIKDLIKDPEKLGFLKKDLIKTHLLLSKLLEEDKGVIIHGDYDADGVTSSAILYELFLSLGFKSDKIKVIIPNRFNHGYGFSKKSFEFLSSECPVKDFPLIITVDCGITAHETVLLAQKADYKVIIIDHHQKKEKLPKAFSIFHNTKYTASVMAYLFSKYMEVKFLKGTDLQKGIDLAGIGYVCDLGDLSEPLGNLITKRSLFEVNTNPREGLNALIKTTQKTGKISSYDYGFLIGPRLNASGRLTSADESLKLLLGEDTAFNSNYLNDTNVERQKLTEKMFEEAVTGLTNKKFVGFGENERVIIADSPNFHEGIIGLIASKLTKSFYKPALCVSWEGDVGKGSCRSIEGVDIVKMLDFCKDFLIDFGGHTMAGGFGIEKKNFTKFIEKCVEYSAHNIDSNLLVPKISYDFDIHPDFLTFDLLEFFEKMEPFGNGNFKPQFVLKNASVENFRYMGADSKHISFNLKGRDIRCIYFDGAKILKNLNTNDSYDILFAFEKNEYRDNVYMQMMVKGIRRSE